MASPQHNIYAVQPVANTNYYAVFDRGEVPGRERALKFLRRLTETIAQNAFQAESIGMARTALETIQTRLETRRLYRVFSHIPGTDAREISYLIRRITTQLDSLSTATPEVTPVINTENPHDFFRVSAEAILFAQNSTVLQTVQENLAYNGLQTGSLSPNQAMLWYEPWKGTLYNRALSREETNGRFVVEYDKENSLMRIVPASEVPPIFCNHVIDLSTNIRGHDGKLQIDIYKTIMHKLMSQ